MNLEVARTTKRARLLLSLMMVVRSKRLKFFQSSFPKTKFLSDASPKPIKKLNIWPPMRPERARISSPWVDSSQSTKRSTIEFPIPRIVRPIKRSLRPVSICMKVSISTIILHKKSNHTTEAAIDRVRQSHLGRGFQSLFFSVRPTTMLIMTPTTRATCQVYKQKPPRSIEQSIYSPRTMKTREVIGYTRSWQTLMRGSSTGGTVIRLLKVK